LRTVIWDFAGQPFAAADVDALVRLRDGLTAPAGLRADLAGLLAPDEVEALASRLIALLADPVYPHPPQDRRAYPYPPV